MSYLPIPQSLRVSPQICTSVVHSRRKFRFFFLRSYGKISEFMTKLTPREGTADRTGRCRHLMLLLLLLLPSRVNHENHRESRLAWVPNFYGPSWTSFTWLVLWCSFDRGLAMRFTISCKIMRSFKGDNVWERVDLNDTSTPSVQSALINSEMSDFMYVNSHTFKINRKGSNVFYILEWGYWTFL